MESIEMDLYGMWLCNVWCGAFCVRGLITVLRVHSVKQPFYMFFSVFGFLGLPSFALIFP
jgi:hypothetical protein